jgi:hypothetical protein
VKHYFSEKTQGFYFEDVHKILPADAFEMNAAAYEAAYDAKLRGKNLAVVDGVLQEKEPPKMPFAKAGSFLRTKRNRLLLESDWTQFQGNHLTPEKRVEWADYRVALRTMFDGVEFTDEVVWPTKPKG